jgi:thiol-disulfide isomerase/thioredoxin
VLGIVAIAAVAFAAYRFWEPPVHPAVGKPAPPLEVIPLLGEAAPLEPHRGAAPLTLLHFWGTWCPPCRLEYPELLEMTEEFAAEPGFRFVSVSCEASAGQNSFKELQRETREYYRSIGVSIPTYCDPASRTRRAIADLLEHPGIYYPSTVLIDQQGTIAGVWEGFTPSGVGKMRQAIARRLNRPADATARTTSAPFILPSDGGGPQQSPADRRPS